MRVMTANVLKFSYTSSHRKSMGEKKQFFLLFTRPPPPPPQHTHKKKKKNSSGAVKSGSIQKQFRSSQIWVYTTTLYLRTATVWYRQPGKIFLSDLMPCSNIPKDSDDSISCKLLLMSDFPTRPIKHNIITFAISQCSSN